MIKNIVFDNGGVFVAFCSPVFLSKFEMYTDLSSDVLAKMLFDLQDSSRIEYGHCSELDFITKFKELSKISLSIKEILTMLYDSIIALPGTLLIAEKLSPNYNLFMLNNDYKERMVYEVKNYPHFNKYFKNRITSCDVGSMKPEEKIYKVLLERYNLIPEECVFIDDRPINIEAAKSFGFHGIVFKDASQLESDLKKLGIKL